MDSVRNVDARSKANVPSRSSTSAGEKTFAFLDRCAMDEELHDYLSPAQSANGRPSADGDELVLVHEATGPRHFLAGRPLHPGAVVELFVVGGQWVRGTYRWTFEPLEPAELAVEEMWGSHRVRLREGDLLRWPAH